MNSELRISPWLAPFVREFTLAVIMTLQGKKFYLPPRQAIHADMVPKFTHHVMHASMRERKILPRKSIMDMEVPDIAPKKVEVKPKQVMQAPLKPESGIGMIKDVPHPEFAWNKILPLLQDPSITSIECNGPGKPILIVRMVKRQKTRIALADNEIRFILGRFAEQSHLPLLEGVFRAAIENYKVHAVISEIIGSKFVISKNTPYSALQGQA